MAPRFSIVIPTIGRLALLRRALHSALRQRDTFEDYEIVVFDNCSEDGTWEYVQSLDNPRLRAFRNPARLSAPESWNKAVRLSRGEYVYTLADDNLLLPGMLATIARSMEPHPGADVVHFAVQYIDEDEAPLRPRTWLPDRPEWLPAPLGVLRLAREFTMATSFLVFTRAIFDASGGLDEETSRYPLATDIESVLRWAVNGDTLLLPDTLALHRSWTGSLTQANAWSPDMFTSMTYTVDRVARFAAESGRLDADQIDELRRVLVQTFLLDLFAVWERVRRQDPGRSARG